MVVGRVELFTVVERSRVMDLDDLAFIAHERSFRYGNRALHYNMERGGLDVASASAGRVVGVFAPVPSSGRFRRYAQASCARRRGRKGGRAVRHRRQAPACLSR